MLPIGGLLGAAAAARVFRGRRRKVLTARQLRRFVPLVVLCLELGGMVSAGMVYRHTGSLGALAVAIALLFAIAPEPWVRLVLVPLGLSRLAWGAQRLGQVSRPADSESRPRATLAGALALLRWPTAGATRFLEGRLVAEVELATTGAAAGALMAFARGDRDLCRSVLLGLNEASTDAGDRQVLRRAGEFLAFDAASRGQWRRVIELARKPESDLTGLSRSSPHMELLYALGQRVLGLPRAPPMADIWPLWAKAPRRRVTWTIIRTVSRSRVESTSAAVCGTFHAHAALLARPSGGVRAADLNAAVLSLDLVRDAPALGVELTRRALALGPADLATRADSVRARVIGEAEDDLAHVVIDESLPAGWIAKGPTGDSIRGRVREMRLGRIEELVGELLRRTHSRIDLEELEEWRAWGDIVGACKESLGDAATELERDTLFRIVYVPLTTYGVRLFNVRARRVLAGAVFRFLRDLARAAGAQDTNRLLARNVAACRGEALPREELVEGDVIGNVQQGNRRLRRLDAAARNSWRLALWIGFGLPSGLGLIAPHLMASPGSIISWASGVVGSVGAGAFFSCRARRVVECAWSFEGLIIQNWFGRFIALPGDIRSVRARADAGISIRLRRGPRWLPRHLVAVTASCAEASAAAARLGALLRGAQSPGCRPRPPAS